VIQDSTFLVMEILAMGSLEDLFEKSCPNALKILDIRTLLKQCLHALEYLHTRRIIHHDLKAKNAKKSSYSVRRRQSLRCQWAETTVDQSKRSTPDEKRQRTRAEMGRIASIQNHNGPKTTQTKALPILFRRFSFSTPSIYAFEQGRSSTKEKYRLCTHF